MGLSVRPSEAVLSSQGLSSAALLGAYLVERGAYPAAEPVFFLQEVRASRGVGWVSFPWVLDAFQGVEVRLPYEEVVELCAWLVGVVVLRPSLEEEGVEMSSRP